MKKVMTILTAAILMVGCGNVTGTDVPVWHQFAGWIGGFCVLMAILLITKKGSIDFQKIKEGDLFPTLRIIGLVLAILGALTLFSIAFGSGCK